MKVSTKVIIAFSFFSLLSATQAQEGWFQQSLATNNHFYSVYFVDQNIGWVCWTS